MRSFSQDTVRTGVFLRLPPRDELQPGIEWFRSYHIPVWYPWDKDQASNSKLVHLAPPVHILQIGTSNMTTNPSLIAQKSSSTHASASAKNTAVPDSHAKNTATDAPIV